MSKKEPNKKRRQSQDDIPLDSDLPDVDRRALEGALADISQLLSEQDFASIDEANAFLQDRLASGVPPVPTERTPLQQAQDLMYQAWGASGSQRVKLTRRALTISPDCADAYVLLAEETAKNAQEAKSLYEQGVQAGERALGQQAFEEAVGSFWGLVETRPYMRARAGLAWCLWVIGDQQQAIDHYQEMLRLNPGDNQGLRYLLANCLLESGGDETLQRLLEQYEDDASATWLYTRALLLFRQQGASEAATDQLHEAISYNPFVPPYLSGKKKLSKWLPPYMGFGDENEAIHYAVDAKSIWRKTKGALSWLRKIWAATDT
jgi:tetratricopeptide (TPR) repeat protein